MVVWGEVRAGVDASGVCLRVEGGGRGESGRAAGVLAWVVVAGEVTVEVVRAFLRGGILMDIFR